MDISRSTVQEIYESARRKIAACLVHGKPLHITGGNYRICGGQEAAPVSYTHLIPEIKPGIVSGALTAFTMSVDDFIISYFTEMCIRDRPRGYWAEGLPN